MGKRYSEISEPHRSFIAQQKIFFVATAASEGRINLSPKGLDSLRVLDRNTVLWLNLTGSGNETAAHLRESERMTLMFCAFEGEPLILRLYGQARAIHPRDAQWQEYIGHLPNPAGARQIIAMHVDLVQTSCGAGVPLYDFTGERDALARWIKKKGPQGIRAYWEEKNQISLDGKATGILES